MSGFLVVAPVIVTSLYAMSRAIEKKHTVDFQLLRNTWTQWQWQRNQETKKLLVLGQIWLVAGFGWHGMGCDVIGLNHFVGTFAYSHAHGFHSSCGAQPRQLFV